MNNHYCFSLFGWCHHKRDDASAVREELAHARATIVAVAKERDEWKAKWEGVEWAWRKAMKDREECEAECKALREQSKP